MSAQRIVRIGQKAFVLSHDGEVIRTMVARLEEDGYQFLDGSSHHRPHWFAFKNAVAEASARIDARQTALRKSLRALAHKRRALETKTYQDGVMNEPYKVVNLRDPMTLVFMCRSRKLKKIRVPEAYLSPGHTAYVVITPMTRFNSDVYQPHKHFVLGTKVMSVCFSPDGQAHYTFSTPFVVEKFFLSRKEAVAELQSFSEPGTKDPVHFVSSRREKEEIDKMPDNLPF